MFPSPALLLQLALGAYAFGVLASLFAWKREQVANVIGFGSATLGGLFGVLSALLALTSRPDREIAAFELRRSLIPYIELSVKLDALAAFFVLIVSLLAL